MVTLDVVVDQAVVTWVRVQPGYLHRAAEKLFEVRDYRALLMLADRHDWQASVTGELGAALTIERLLGLEVPQRAGWLRVLLAELARIHSHLAALSFVCFRAGDAHAAGLVRDAREQHRQLMLGLSGNRVHPMIVRLGGLEVDADREWLAAAGHFADTVTDLGRRLVDLIVSEPFGSLSSGVAPLPADWVHPLGLSGPAAKSAGIVHDLRLDPGYFVYSYPELSAIIADRYTTTGDAAGRFQFLAHEVGISARLVRCCVTSLASLTGPVNVRLAKVIKLPEGECHASVEAPWGEAGWHLVSRADRTPWRLRLRTPTFANVQALEHVLVGVDPDRLDVAIASMGYAIGDLDK